MKLVGMVACYREDHRELELMLESLQDVCEHVILAEPVGDDLEQFAYVQRFGDRRWLTRISASWSREREKRNALLEAAKSLIPERELDRSWLLAIDPDEELMAGRRLRLMLERYSEPVPGYPLLRQEGDGRVHLVPCKLLRANVESYTYLDVGVSWRGELWNLDPIALEQGAVLAFWPHLMHYGSARARQRWDDWYSEDVPFLFERTPDFAKDYAPA